MWRVIKIILAIYLGVNLIAAYIFWPRIDQFLRFMPRVTPANISLPVDGRDAQKQDLSYLETILKYDRSFSKPDQDKFLSRLAALKTSDDRFSSSEFYLAIRELMALADNAHTGVESSPAFQEFNRSGADLYFFSDGYFVVRAHKSHSDILGKKVTAIDGQPIAGVVAALRKYTGGTDNWRDLQSLYFLRSPQLLHGAGLIDSPNELILTVLDELGSEADVKLEALPSIAEAGYFRHGFLSLSPNALDDEGADWVRTLDRNKKEIAPYLQDLSKIVSHQKMGDGLYLRSSYLMGSSEVPVKKMLLEPLSAVPSGGYEFIAVDLRWNPGGDFGNAVPFARKAKSALSKDGKIYVIVGPGTFSAAIVFSALLEQAAPDQTHIIGESMGDRPQFWAERGKPFILPNSGYWINYSTGYHDWENGCSSTHEFCFPPNQKHEKELRALGLDKLIQPSYSDYRSGRDIVMDWVLDQTQ